MTTRDKLFGIKAILLVIALVLLLSSLGDLLLAINPATCAGIGCIMVSNTQVLIQGVDFVGTLRAAILGAVVTVVALSLDVAEYFLKDGN